MWPLGSAADTCQRSSARWPCHWKKREQTGRLPSRRALLLAARGGDLDYADGSGAAQRGVRAARAISSPRAPWSGARCLGGAQCTHTPSLPELIAHPVIKAAATPPSL
ncbi:hypothetical protein MRX96_005243 [Rhipicephalus microplus]